MTWWQRMWALGADADADLDADLDLDPDLDRDLDPDLDPDLDSGTGTGTGAGYHAPELDPHGRPLRWVGPLAALLLLLSSLPARAQSVVETIGADAEVHDVAVLDGRTLLATSGGLRVAHRGRVVQHLTEGLPGIRLRSVSVVGERAYLGGIDGLTEVALEQGRAQVVRTLPLRRVRRVVAWNGALYAAGYAGLHRLEGETSAPVALGRSHARQRLTDLLVRGDELWVATGGAGVVRLGADHRVRGRWTRRQGLRHDYVWDLLVYGEEVVVGTMMGVSVVREGRVQRSHDFARAALPVRDVRRLVAHQGGVYAATFGGGLRRLDRAERVGAGELRAFAAASTPEGIVVGHVAGAQLGERTLLTGGLPSADLTSLAYAFGKVFVGSFDRGLATLREGRVVPVERARTRYAMDGRINDLAVTGRGRTQRLWIATDRGLYWHDGRRFAPVESPRGPGRQHVTSLHVDAAGALWVTSSRVLARWTGGDRWTSWDSDAGFPVAQLHAVTTQGRGADMEVWVGSLHGLYRFDPRTGRATPHTVATGDLPVDWVTALATVGGEVVAGTYHGGLSWRRGGRFHIESEARGLPAGWVNPHAMASIEGRLWVGTLDRGLMIGRRGSWTHLRTGQGLPSNDVTDVLRVGEDVWVATRAGLARMR